MTVIRFGLTALCLAAGFLAFTPEQSHAQKRQRDRISREEIDGSAHKDLDLYQVVRSLRPQFLEPPKGVRSARGNSVLAPIAVYVDGRRETGVDALKMINPSTVREVRFLDANKSANEYGPTVNGGAILVKSLKKSTADTSKGTP